MEPYREVAEATDFHAFWKVVNSRRSVRKFTNEKVPEAIMEKCLDAALLAPTSSNLQCWEFHWVRTPELRRKLDVACFSQSAATTAAEIVVAVARTKTWSKHRREMVRTFRETTGYLPPKIFLDYYEKIVPLVYAQGWFSLFGLLRWILFTGIGLFRPMPREPHSHGAMKIWAVKTTALACENLMLALRAAGYDSCPMEGLDSWRVRRLLKLPSDAVVVMAIGAGRRDPTGVYGPRVRFRRDWFVKRH